METSGGSWINWCSRESSLDKDKGNGTDENIWVRAMTVLFSNIIKDQCCSSYFYAPLNKYSIIISSSYKISKFSHTMMKIYHVFAFFMICFKIQVIECLTTSNIIINICHSAVTRDQ